MASIRDIAAKTGFSVSTISRALNQYDDVKPATRELIIQAAEELNYFPSAVARGLVIKKTFTIGLFFGDQVNSGFDHPFFLEVLSAIRKKAGDAGYDLVIFANTNKKKSTYTSLCRERGVDGVFLVLTGEGKKKTETITELQDSGIPCVAIDLPLDGSRATYVESDNYHGAKAAVTHLLQSGHRQIAYIDGDDISKVSVDRLGGYKAALQESGITPDPELIVPGYFDENSTRGAVRQLLDTDKNVTAIFAASDEMAITAIDELHRHDKHVPEDVSVIGFDDLAEAERHDPPLTTVRQNRYEMGSAAISILTKLIDEPEYEPAPAVLPCELIVRASTSPLFND
ncbi:LacI family DNA-binding transcriptional regulator [Alteribacillus sp. HJP-4]|uniref:LacI family DNA-binding transcriptional regulator n=1 Tax=Alteribacillus sp. HJP-4 TaxID=2775394 RepID=UPI0035CD095F